MWLKKRKALILISLINLYNSTHQPVSSKRLTQLVPFADSTIRKELQNLESQGFIYKRSTSSGRIPTDRGIKYYLNELIDNLETNQNTIGFPEVSNADFNNISNDFLTLLSTNTNNVGFIFLNSIFDLNFSRITLFKIGYYRVMIILQSLNNWTFSKIFKIQKNYSDKDLKKWEAILNREFKGKTLKHSFKRIRNKLYKEKEKYIKIYRELYYLLGSEDLMTAEFFFKGILNILDSHLVNASKVKKLLETLEEKENFSRFWHDILFSHTNSRTPKVAFGTDTGISELEDFLFIFSNLYYSKYPIGNIGVIGPKFMPYPNTITQVNQFSSHFSKILTKNPMEV